jgi:hypothetical protein
MPKAARERPATPPAGTALAPEPQCAFAAGPFTERESQKVCVTDIETFVNKKETKYSRHFGSENDARNDEED